MTSRILLVFLFFFVAEKGFAQDSRFIDRLWETPSCRSCYVLSIDVISDAHSGRATIDSGKLFTFLMKTRGLEGNQADDFVRTLLQKKQALRLENATLDGNYLNVAGSSRHEFRIVQPDKKVDEITGMGCANFIRYYFLNETPLPKIETASKNCRELIRDQKRDLILTRTDIGITGMNSLINSLFEWQIPVMIDHISGLPVIYSVAVDGP